MYRAVCTLLAIPCHSDHDMCCFTFITSDNMAQSTGRDDNMLQDMSFSCQHKKLVVWTQYVSYLSHGKMSIAG